MPGTTLTIGENLRQKNANAAERNRAWFRDRRIFAINFLSSPGSGKTELLARTLAALKPDLSPVAIVGDLATDCDATRLRQSGCQAVQISTGTTCHLDAAMVSRACMNLNINDCRFLAIENIGNLVCPATWPLGEHLRVVLLSVTEGEDKPLKYPHVFYSADVTLITKTDLAKAAGFQRETLLANLDRAAPKARRFELSARTGEGMPAWYDFLREQVHATYGTD